MPDQPNLLLIFTDQQRWDTLRAYGNTAGGLPYTVLVSPAGEVLFSRAGTLPEREAEQLILEHLSD